MSRSEILVPALQSQWLMMHVSMMVLGYAALLCGSLLLVALLVITFRQDIRILCKNNHFLKSHFPLMRFNISLKETMFYKILLFFMFEIITRPNLFNNWIIGVIVLLV